MSDILIRGMEMPQDGVYWCEIGVAGEIATITIHGEDRKSFPLVPVPPHGDLVDRAEMREIAISLLDEAVTDQEANAIREMWSRFGQMPVFIPAEEGET